MSRACKRKEHSEKRIMGGGEGVVSRRMCAAQQRDKVGLIFCIPHVMVTLRCCGDYQCKTTLDMVKMFVARASAYGKGCFGDIYFFCEMAHAKGSLVIVKYICMCVCVA